MIRSATGTPPGFPGLGFSVLSARVDRQAASPAILLRLQVSAPERVRLRSIMLRTQVRIDARRPAYDESPRLPLHELFGGADGEGESVRTVVWTQSVIMVSPFRGETTVDVRLPCTYDFEVAGAKLLQGLGDGAIPLVLYFSGIVFFTGSEGGLQAAMLPWDDEVRFDLPVELWREAVDRFFPGQAWLRLDRKLYERLCRIRSREGWTTWEDAVGSLLARAGEGVEP